MTSLLEVGLSNALVALLIAILAVVACKIWRQPTVAHTLWLLVLVKLITPPLFTVPCGLAVGSWQGPVALTSVPQDNPLPSTISQADHQAAPNDSATSPKDRNGRRHSPEISFPSPSEFVSNARTKRNLTEQSSKAEAWKPKHQYNTDRGEVADSVAVLLEARVTAAGTEFDRAVAGLQANIADASVHPPNVRVLSKVRRETSSAEEQRILRDRLQTFAYRDRMNAAPDGKKQSGNSQGEINQQAASDDTKNVALSPTPVKTEQGEWSVIHRLPDVIVLIWLGGSCVCIFLALTRMHRFARFLSNANASGEDLAVRAKRLAKRFGLRRCPTILLVPGRISPMLYGSGTRSIVLLPSALLDKMSAHEQDALIAHELAHLRRGDQWVRWIEMAATILYWWHPVLWWARHRLRESEELCCDALVVRVTNTPREVYANTLLDTAGFVAGHKTFVPMAASAVGNTNSLKRRLGIIMHQVHNTPVPRTAWASIAILACLCLPFLPSFAAQDSQTAERAGPNTQVHDEESIAEPDPKLAGERSVTKTNRKEAISRLALQSKNTALHAVNAAVQALASAAEHKESHHDADAETDASDKQLNRFSRRDVGCFRHFVRVQDARPFDASIRELKIRTQIGEIRVVRSKDAELKIKARIRADASRTDLEKAGRTFDDHVRVTVEGGVVTIADAHKDAPDKHAWAVSLTVATPRAVPIECRTGVGSVDVQLARGIVSLHTGVGDVKLTENTIDSIVAKTGAGSVMIGVEQITKSLKASTGAGHVGLRIENASGTVDANTGEVIPEITEEQVRTAALADFIPEADIASLTYLEGDPPLEYRKNPMPVYRVVFDHPKQTHLYISPVTGEVIKRRNNPWRLFDFFWMLHIMDYRERDNFNHPLLTTMSLIAVSTSLTGLVLWWYRIPQRKRQVVLQQTVE